MEDFDPLLGKFALSAKCAMDSLVYFFSALPRSIG